MGEIRSGAVTIAGTSYMPPEAGDLPELFRVFSVELSGIKNVYERATLAFLRMAQTRFFDDVNKRMGRFMMNGILLSFGFPVINVPFKKQLEFNEKMLDFYGSNNVCPMQEFLYGCVDERVVKIMEA